ncbi:hypothetical protein [Streptomyces gobiensis]|uniref:hypothetical protein n=1 Tax=Streptomyces gobiensis TaxID=2875706 RepID=UPI001E598D77|nr:hypothetical protein [Streptomyces gobiensis]UGY93499.1 hypothetical protein test1122_18405 [Streptomyces gobiensis]
MPVDPTDPETFEKVLEEVLEEDEAPVADPEAPEADAAEQHADVVPERDAEVKGNELDSANPADVVEQTRIVETNEDEYR